MPTWVAVWDQSLSGKTMSTQLQRLGSCQAMMPTVSERYLIGACPLVTKEALDRVHDNCPAIYTVYSRKVDTPENLVDVSMAWKERVGTLCMDFYSRYVARNQTESDRELRGVEAFGYKNSYALLLDHGNCPNNAPPVLWYTTNGYQPPFLRRASGHTTPAPEEVRKLDVDKMADAAARLALSSRTKPLSNTQVMDDAFSVTDLTDSADLQMASALLRFGALVNELPLELRRRLSELSMVMAVDAAAWERSWHPTGGSLIDKWRCGVSIGIALALSAADGRVRDSMYSHRAPGPSGQPLSWWQHCTADLGLVRRFAPGNLLNMLRRSSTGSRRSFRKSTAQNDTEGAW
jgi:hypothetical protein